MYIRKKYHKNLLNIFFSISIITIFCYFILAANNYKVEEKYNWVNASFLNIQEWKRSWYIPLDNIISIKNEDNYKFTYIVQPGDNISKIANRFGVTIKNVKDTNWLKNDTITPGQKLIITENKWFIYQLDKKITLKDFSQKYKLDIEKLKQLNYIEKENKQLAKWDELFLPISLEEAKEKGIVKKQEKKKIENQQQSNNQSNGGRIVQTYYYNPQITNWFFPGHCTRYVAIKKFPYKSQYKQKKLWNWNWNQWFYNAKKAWYKVWQTPKTNSIVVLRYGGNWYTYYWHVAIVKQIDRNKRSLLVEDMNARGRFIVTKRRISMDRNVIGYIYY